MRERDRKKQNRREKRTLIKEQESKIERITENRRNCKKWKELQEIERITGYGKGARSTSGRAGELGKVREVGRCG